MKPVQAVLLAGGQCKPMFPLTSPGVQALLPVVNVPLLKFPLHLLSQAEVTQVIVVATGEEAALQISNWLSKEYSHPGSSLSYEIIKASENCGTGEAIRLAAHRITTEHFVVLSGDLVTDVPLNAVLLQHQVRGALATVLLNKAKEVEKKLGKAPKNVDYIGLSSSQDQLVFHAAGYPQLKDLKVLRAVQRQCGGIDIHTDLVDSHLYVFSRNALDTLTKPTMSSISQDVIPYLTKMQFRGDLIKGEEAAGQSDDTDGEADAKTNGDHELPGSRYMDMSHADEPTRTSRVEVYIAAEQQYCARVNTAAAFLDVNREVAASKKILDLIGIELSSKTDNYVPSSCTFGNKATVGSGCILGENTVLGDKSSVKRSILGSNCKLGKEVKLINCVLLDNVVVGDGSHLQNSVICSGAVVNDGVKLKDCQIGPGYQVAKDSDVKEAVLAKPS